MQTKLCLGTVQLGLPYGITNNQNKVPKNDVIEILSTASRLGINTLDTAQSYGCSEEYIGKYWPKSSHCKIISKLPPNISKQNKDHWESIFRQSLINLQTDKLYGLLVHDPSDLQGLDGTMLMSWLISLKERGLIEHIGVSIYSSDELEWIPIDQVNIIQLPVSIYDQRLIKNNTIAKLHEYGISIHARSIFLQGITLEKVNKWPKFLSIQFREHHEKLQASIEEDTLSLLDASIGFIKLIPHIEYILTGVVNSSQLLDINNSFEKFDTKADFTFLKKDWSWSNEKDISPSKW